MLNFLLDNRTLETLTVNQELSLTLRPHVVGNQVARAGIDFKRLAVVSTPLVDVRFKLSDVRTERHDVVRVEHTANSLIDFLSRDFPVWVVLRIPHVQQEDRAILDATRTQGSVVARTRTIEP